MVTYVHVISWWAAENNFPMTWEAEEWVNLHRNVQGGVEVHSTRNNILNVTVARKYNLHVTVTIESRGKEDLRSGPDLPSGVTWAWVLGPG